MHREDLVVLIRIEEVVVGSRELKPHQRRFDATQNEEHKSRDDVAHRNRFVVCVSKPAAQTARSGPRALELFLLALHCGSQFPVVDCVLLWLFPAHFKLCK